MGRLMPAALLALIFGALAAAACEQQLQAYAQCGGSANCKGAKCGDKAWPGTCCPPGSSCVRSNPFYHQCMPAAGAAAPPARAAPAAPSDHAANAPAPVPAAAAPAPQTPAPAMAAKKSGGSYDYGQVLGLSLMFYEAQRSGKLPPGNRIPWRGDSGVGDRGPDGRDVSGGWYDAGDNVKFNLPMAWSAGVLAWSLVDFEAGYKAAGEYRTALATVKWATDYFIKCIGDGKTDVVVQVGNGAQDHAVWRRPEDVTGPVPVYVVTPDKPGSDVVGAMGAALAAAAVAFKRADPAYSARLIAASRAAYNFASSHLGKYSVAVPDAGAFYPSSNYMDDIALNALWLAAATGDGQYKAAGLKWYMRHLTEEDGAGVWDNFDWDSNSWGAALLLSRFYPSNPLFAARLNGFVKAWTTGSGVVQMTPKGLAFSGPWGSLRHVGNACFLMKAYAKAGRLSAATKASIDCTVRRQLGYILGDTGRSFVVGYGSDPPARPHHRGSSCPSPAGAPCGWEYFQTAQPNPHTLFGALVGGPGPADEYSDDRNDFIKNEVATDYNAGFTGALAAAAQGLTCKQ